MMKQIRVVVEGKVTDHAFECFSWNGGRSSCSDPKAMLSFLRHRKVALEFQFTDRELGWLDGINECEESYTESLRCAIRVHV